MKQQHSNTGGAANGKHGRFTGIISSVAVILLLLYGWYLSRQRIWVAEEGAGYAMGIIGGSMMLMLLLYPLRKRLRFMHRWLPIRYWFAAHMMLGILGPVTILYHSNFGLGSLNSNIALFSMLLVSTSGLLGRFFYVRIHKGLYGRKIHLSELSNAITTSAAAASSSTDQSVLADHILKQVNGLLDKPVIGIRDGYALLRTVREERRKLARKRKKTKPGKESDDLHALENKLLSSAVSMARFVIYERLFSWWHIIHIPLFIMLIITATIHIIAVHRY